MSIKRPVDLRSLARRLWKPRLWLLLALPIIAWWLLRNLPLAALKDILSAVNPWALAGLVGFNLLAMLVFSSRWWLILRSLGERLPYLAIFRYRTAGFAISYFTPGTQFGGEPLQIYALQSRHGMPADRAAASVTLDKLFELQANFTFLAFGLVAILSLRLSADLSPGLAAWVLVPLLGPLLYLVGLGVGFQPLSLAVQRMPGRWREHRLLGKAPAFIQGTEAQVGIFLRHKPRTLLAVLLTSVAIWLLSMAEYWLALAVFGARLSPVETLAALTAARLAFLTPLPGGLGALEAGQMLAMQALGYEPALGLAISLWMRLRDVGLGLLGLWLGSGLLEKRPQPSTSVDQAPAQAGDLKPFHHMTRLEELEP